MAAEEYFSYPRPRLYGHRGAAGVAPENTLPSFERAVHDGAGYLELDVHATRDGVVVVIHDPTLERTTDGAGAVRDLTLQELRRFDAGFRFEHGGAHPFRGRGVRVPALEELLDAFPTMPLNIEIKQAEPAIESRVVALLERKGAAARTLLAAESDAIMRRIRTCAPGMASKQALDRQPGSAPEAMLAQCFQGIFGAGGFESAAAGWTEDGELNGRENDLVE